MVLRTTLADEIVIDPPVVVVGRTATPELVVVETVNEANAASFGLHDATPNASGATHPTMRRRKEIRFTTAPKNALIEYYPGPERIGSQ